MKPLLMNLQSLQKIMHPPAFVSPHLIKVWGEK